MNLWHLDLVENSSTVPQKKKKKHAILTLKIEAIWVLIQEVNEMAADSVDMSMYLCVGVS